MEFVLHYRGPLRANAKPADKHSLRRHFHLQLQRLWDQPPLRHYRDFFADPPRQGRSSLRTPLHGFVFVPLVSERIHLVAQLQILLLRPEPPGRILTQSGDLDNRLKTLLDALKVPRESTALPPETRPASDEAPFFCLLEDDALVTGVTVDTERLLDSVCDVSEVVLVIRVRTELTQTVIENIGLG